MATLDWMDEGLADATTDLTAGDLDLAGTTTLDLALTGCALAGLALTGTDLVGLALTGAALAGLALAGAALTGLALTGTALAALALTGSALVGLVLEAVFTAAVGLAVLVFFCAATTDLAAFDTALTGAFLGVVTSCLLAV